MWSKSIKKKTFFDSLMKAINYCNSWRIKLYKITWAMNPEISEWRVQSTFSSVSKSIRRKGKKQSTWPYSKHENKPIWTSKEKRNELFFLESYTRMQWILTCRMWISPSIPLCREPWFKIKSTSCNIWIIKKKGKL